MKFYISLFLILITSICSAQTESREQYSVWQQQEENTAMIYANKANVRADASIGSAVKDSLNAGDTVFVNKFTKEFYKQNGIYAPWADISYIKDGLKKTGFIWMGSLATGYTIKEDQTFLFGIESAKMMLINKEFGPQNQFEVKVKMIQDKSVVASTALLVPDDESFSFLELKVLGNPNLKNISEVVRIMFGGEACGA